MRFLTQRHQVFCQLHFCIYLFLFFSLVFLACSSNSNYYDTNNLPKFPAYTEHMLKEKSSCGVPSIFGSCYAECENQKNCDCESTYISCSCACLDNDGKSVQKPTSVMSVSLEQYKNWEKFSQKLKEINSPHSLEAYLNMVEMFKFLKESDSFGYYKESEKFINSLKKLSNVEKKSLNRFLKELSENSFQIP